MEDLEGLYYFGTGAGKKVSYVNPDPNEICREDIATSLSRQKRGLGHDVANIAQHSLIVTFLACSRVEDLSPQNRALLLHALMHDAGEAYTGDIPMTMKKFIKALWLAASKEAANPIAQIEERLDKAIAIHFGIPTLAPRQKGIIKECDFLALSLEKRDVFTEGRRRTFDESGYTFPEAPCNVEMRILSEKEAKESFLSVLGLLLGERNPQPKSTLHMQKKIQKKAGLGCLSL